jgi:hypothetical protein
MFHPNANIMVITGTAGQEPTLQSPSVAVGVVRRFPNGSRRGHPACVE